jgi:hypothetical protein
MEISENEVICKVFNDSVIEFCVDCYYCHYRIRGDCKYGEKASLQWSDMWK